MATRKSLVLVTVDCLRADHCGFMGYGRPTTPFLDGLAGESFVFPTAIVAGVPTPYSFPPPFWHRVIRSIWDARCWALRSNKPVWLPP
jgi:glucan phosphoethanolaminetransferase (alkaline phosphatase superfamily)